jgi:hypothetical protein
MLAFNDNLWTIGIQHMEKFDITKNTIESYIKKMRTTSYARYDAHKRCERLNNSSLFALTSTSLLLIFLGIIGKYSSSNCPFINQEHIEIFATFASIIILALSLVVSFASYTLKSERFFRSGNDIAELCDQLNIINEQDSDSVRRCMLKYNQLRKNSENHPEHSYKRGRLARKRQKNDTLTDSDKLSVFDNISYWSPIGAFYLLSSISFSVFIYVIYKFFSHA